MVMPRKRNADEISGKGEVKDLPSSRAARDRKTTYNTYPVNLLCIMNYVIQSLARRVRQNFIDMYTNFSGLSYNIFAWGNF